MFKRLFLALATLTITVSASAQASPILLTFDTSGVATDAHLLAGGVGSVDYTFFTDSKNVTLDIAGVNPPSPYFGTDLISGWISGLSLPTPIPFVLFGNDLSLALSLSAGSYLIHVSEVSDPGGGLVAVALTAISSVPEPSTWLLAVLGLALLFSWRYRPM